MQLTTLLVALSVLVAAAPAAAQSTVIETYTLLAERTIRAKRLTLTAGDIGVTDPEDGRMMARNTLEAPISQVSAATVRLRDGASQCADLFANLAVTNGPGCSNPQPFTSPFTDLAAACDFPAPFPTCDPDAPTVVVQPGEIRSLPPGTYGDVLIAGNPSGFGTLQLGGTYQFCTLKASLDAVTVFTSPSTINVENALILSRATTINPTISAEDIKIFVEGINVRISRNATVTAVMCAPNATIGINNGAMLSGRFIARQVRLKKNAIIGIPVSTTTSTSSITTTTLEPGTTTTTLDPGTTTTTLEPGSTTTTLVPGSTTTTLTPGSTTSTIAPGSTTTTSTVPGSTSTSTTTTPTSSTTTTTLIPDGGNCTDDAQCQSGLCEDGTCVPALVEICGNCIDDNLNDLTDFEDPACCSGSAGQVFVTDFRRGKIKPRSETESVLRLKSVLATGGFEADAATDEVQLQIREQDGPEVLCTIVPPAGFAQKGRVFKFKNPDGAVESAKGVRLMFVKMKKNGEVRFKAKAKQGQFATPTTGSLHITVGFRDPSGANPPRCSATDALFRRNQKGALIYP